MCVKHNLLIPPNLISGQTLTLGREYIEQQRFSEAVRVLAPVASDPHASAGGMVASLYNELASRELGLDQTDLVIDQLASEIENAESENEAAEAVIDEAERQNAAEGASQVRREEAETDQDSSEYEVDGDE